MSDRDELIREIEHEIESRKLVWFGTVGADARPLLEFDQFDACISFTTPLDAISVREEVCLERISGTRVCLDTYRPQEDDSEAMETFRERMSRCLDEPSVVVPYRSMAMLSNFLFPRRGTLEYLGLFHQHQALFEHKPWVETQLRDETSVETIPWRYYGPHDHDRIFEASFGEGPLVVRRTHSTGGEGIEVVEDEAALRRFVESTGESILSLAPYYEEGLSVNVNGCVFPDGTVTVHPGSVQLVGIKGCTARTLGYCGNDFAAMSELDDAVLRDLDDLVRETGEWLSDQGYTGAFGVDALLRDGTPYLTEVNPRFQGSSELAARLDAEASRPDQYLLHIAAFLGLDSPSRRPRLDGITDGLEGTQVYFHELGGAAEGPESILKLRSEGQATMQSAPGVTVEEGGITERRLYRTPEASKAIRNAPTYRPTDQRRQQGKVPR